MQSSPWSPLRACSRLLAPLAAIVTAACAPVAYAQDSMTPYNHPQAFDGSYPVRLYFLLFFCVTFPMLLTSSLLLWKRRHSYPIVGRGAPFLLVSSIIFIVASLFQSLFLVVWPNGVPCGIFFIQLVFLLCKSAVSVTRGWVLVYQLEILNFHREVQWRQAKMSIQQKFSDQLLAFQQLQLRQESPTSLSGRAYGTSSPNSSVSSIAPSSVINAVTVHEKIELSIPSVPGYAYITTRRSAELGAISRFVTVGFCLTLITMACIAKFDPDVELTDKFLRDRGLLSPSETTHSQFSSDNFLNAPICLVDSVKVLVLLGVSFLLVTPTVAWIIFRLRVNKQRQSTRLAEQREFYQVLKNASTAHSAHKAANSHKQSPDAAPNRAPTDILDSTDGRALNFAIHADYEEDGILREMIVRIIAVLFGLALHFPIQAYQPGLTVHLQQVGFFVMFCFSILRPVRQSYENAKSQSDHFMHHRSAQEASPTRKLHEVPGSRNNFAVWPAAHSTSSHSKNQIVPVISDDGSQLQSPNSQPTSQLAFDVRQLPSHHRPLYSLTHILQHNPGYTAYLHFLQGEHASEYALFWRECAAFEHAARKLERSVPHWPHNTDPESSMTPQTQQKHGRHSSWSTKPAVRVTTAASRNESVSPPRSPASIMPMPPTPAAGSQQPTTANSFAVRGEIIKPVRSRSSPNLNSRSLLDGPGNVSATSAKTGNPESYKSNPARRSNGASNPSSPNFQPDQQKSSAALPALPVRNNTIHPSQVELSKRLKVVLPSGYSASSGSTHAGSGLSLKEEANRLKQWAFKIEQEFLANSAMYAIHVPPDFLEQLQIQLCKLQWWDPLNRKANAEHEAAAAMFDDSSYPTSPPLQLSALYSRLQTHVYLYLKSDSFRRFVMHANFQMLQQDADRMEGLKIERLHQHQLQMHQYQQMVQAQQQQVLQQQRQQEQMRQQQQLPTFHVESDGYDRPLSSHAVSIRRSLDGETPLLTMAPMLTSSKSDGSTGATSDPTPVISTALVALAPLPAVPLSNQSMYLHSRAHKPATGANELRVKVLKSLMFQSALERKASPSLSPNSSPISTNDLDQPQADWSLPLAPLNNSESAAAVVTPALEPN